MIPQYWSWLLACIGVAGLWYAGSHRLLGWQIGIGVQVLWIAYAIVSKQWGFIASAFAYGTVNIRNLLKWRKERMTDPAEKAAEEIVNQDPPPADLADKVKEALKKEQK